MEKRSNKPELEAMQKRLANVRGDRYWRGLDELAETDEFKQWLDDEFPARASLPDVDRRSFLKFMGASLAMAGLAGCRMLPQEKIVPYVKAPEERLPGQALQYATAMPFNGYGLGLLITSNEGRPSKAEGNPDHPSSLGSTDAYAQAELLQFYDPDRPGAPMVNGFPSTWEQFLEDARKVLDAQRASGGAGIRLLTEPVTSPTMFAQIQGLLGEFKNAKWYQFTPFHRDNERLGSQLAFGKIVDPQYDFSKAAVVLAIDSDFLGCSPGDVRHTRDFMSNRDPESGRMNRLYSIESTYSVTGAFADHRRTAKPSEIEDIVRYLGSMLGVEGGPGKLPAHMSNDFLSAVAMDLTAHKGACLVVAGSRAAPQVHAIVHAINHALGNVGKTVSYTNPVEVAPRIQYQELKQLVADINTNTAELLLIVGGNPAFTAPPDLGFAQAVSSFTARGKMSAYLGFYQNETSQTCEWHLPMSHFLEAWGDIRSHDGTASIIQPLIQPLNDSRSDIEVLSDLRGKPSSGLDLVRASWIAKMSEKDWRDALNRGTIKDSAMAPITVAPKPGFAQSRGEVQAGPYEAVFEPDPTIYDGRYANNGWLQELPKPITKLSWDNAVLMSPASARDLGVVYQDMVSIKGNGGPAVEAPVFVVPGHPDGVVTLHLGYGCGENMRVAQGTGFNFNLLRNSRSPFSAPVEIKPTGKTFDLAVSQTHHSMDGRDIVREGSLEDLAKNPDLHPEDAYEDETSILYNLTREWSQSGVNQWGMVIDLNLCTGCNACVTACYAENNISVVGKSQVQRGRIMHWIRVDRYFRVAEGAAERDLSEPISEYESINPTWDTGAMNPDNVKSVSMPVPCMHCETAPCEPVCPVAATVHSHEGLNQMVYNRCVGTRYCSNNCPYKVRRFNFMNYQMSQPNFPEYRDLPLLNLLNNPDVTVRSRGVMEKCSYCVQRINHARIEAKKEGAGGKILDGQVVTACAQACPSRAITFGDIADPTTAVAKLKAKRRNYSLLADLNTRPRTTYLGKVRNLNKGVPV